MAGYKQRSTSKVNIISTSVNSSAPEGGTFSGILGAVESLFAFSFFAPVPATEPVTAESAPARHASDCVTTTELRSLLKSKLGYNAKQVTAKCRHSQQYLDLTIRDASVDVAAVQEFAASLNTWSMDQTDYCSGQSINVSTTREVDAIHAEPFVEEAKSAVAKIMADEHGSGTKLANGKFLWRQDREYYVSAGLNGKRGCYIRSHDVENGAEWAIAALALQIARI